MKYQSKKIIFTSGGYTLSGIIEYPPHTNNKAVIFSHGLTNSKSASDNPVLYQIRENLLDNGFITFRFDYTGSGESEGEFKDKTISKMFVNLNDAIDYFKTTHLEIDRIGLCGKSIGGTTIGLLGADSRITTSVFLTTPVSLEVVFGPLFQGQKEVKISLPNVQPSGKIKGEFVLKKDFFLELKNIDSQFLKEIKSIKNSLVVLNQGDEKVSWENSSQVYNLLKQPKKLLQLETYRHELDDQVNIVVNKVGKFFKENL